MNKLPKKGMFVKKSIPLFAEQWWPGEEVDNVTEIKHTTLGIIGRIDVVGSEYGE